MIIIFMRDMVDNPHHNFTSDFRSAFDRIPFDSQITLLGKGFLFRRYGLCHPHNLRLIKEGAVVYEWDREGETRREYFFGRKKPSRVYEQNQSCFTEYLDFVTNNLRFPQEAEVSPPLIGRHAKLYQRSLEKMLES